MYLRWKNYPFGRKLYKKLLNLNNDTQNMLTIERRRSAFYFYFSLTQRKLSLFFFFNYYTTIRTNSYLSHIIKVLIRGFNSIFILFLFAWIFNPILGSCLTKTRKSLTNLTYLVAKFPKPHLIITYMNLCTWNKFNS